MSNMARELSVNIGNPSVMGQFGEKCIVTIDWTADSAGGVSGEIASTYSAPIGQAWKCKPTKLTGTLRQINTVPGQYGDLATNLPSDGYDMSLIGPYNNDIAGGALGNRSRTSGEILTFANPVFLDFPVTFKVINAGSGGKGRTILLFVD
jgi:hypothetical protein